MVNTDFFFLFFIKGVFCCVVARKMNMPQFR